MMPRALLAGIAWSKAGRTDGRTNEEPLPLASAYDALVTRAISGDERQLR
jgi:hypothetical protein